MGSYQFEGNTMSDSDLVVVLLLLTVVVIALLAPPGPGTPLRAPLPTR